jgi:hypothetical protein
MKYWFIQGEIINRHTLGVITLIQEIFEANDFSEVLRNLNTSVISEEDRLFKINFVMGLSENEFNTIKGNKANE